MFGIHMRFLPSPGDGGEIDRLVAQREEVLLELAAKCHIALTIVDLREQFDKAVVVPFIEAYRRGLTPNPCILCNPRIKFGLLQDEALGLGAERLATGHYVRIFPPARSDSDRFQLRRANDPSKDQSYFLMGLSQEQLAHSCFPLGELTKSETLAWAEQTGVKSLISEDSQEICFIPSGSYPDFLRRRAGGDQAPRGGPILDLDGNLLGEHKGIYSYTVGQRRGLGIPSTEPYYVIGIEPGRNALRIGRAKDLYSEMCIVSKVNWVSISRPETPITCQVRIRNLHKPAPAEVSLVDDNSVRVRFSTPQRAVTPGQAAVFYADDLLLGGGMIERS